MTTKIRASALLITSLVLTTHPLASAQQAAVPPQAGSASNYPSKPIRLISPFVPGGGASIVARMINVPLGERLKQPVVVDNRAGAGGTIGTEIAAHAPPDGYTLVMATASTVVVNPLVSKVNFDPEKDFAPVAHTSTVPLVLVVHPSVPVKSVHELIALAKSRAEPPTFASSGTGTISHLAGELFKRTAGVNMLHVPYKGGGQAIIDLVGGHVQTGFVNILEALPNVKAGRLRGLAVTSPTRWPTIPDIPTVAENGLPKFQVVQWSGVLAPARTPQPIIARLHAEISAIISGSPVKEQLIASGAEPGSGTAEAFGNFIKAELATWSAVIKSSNIKITD